MRLLLTVAMLAIYISVNGQTEQTNIPESENPATSSSTVSTEKVTNQRQISMSKVRKPRAEKQHAPLEMLESPERKEENPDLREHK